MNPFSQMLQQMQSKGGSQTGGQHPMLQHAVQSAAPQPTAGDMPPGMAGGMTGGTGGAAAKAMMPSTSPGSNPGSTDSLIKALGAMNQVITATDDSQEIQDARQIILILQQMIQRDQQKQTGKESALGQAQTGASQFPSQLQAPGGQL